MKTAKSILSLIWLTSAIGLSAQTQPTAPLTLDDCIRLASQQSIEVQKRHLQLHRLSLQLENSRHAFLPTLSASLSQNFDFGRSSDKTGVMQDRSSSTSSFSLSASVPLFTGFRRLHDQRAARLQIESADAELEQTHRDIRREVISLYFALLHAQRVEQSAARESSLYQDIVLHAQAMTETGRWSHDRLAEAQAQQASSQLRLVEAQNAVSTAHLDLMQILERREMLPIEEINIYNEVVRARGRLDSVRGAAELNAFSLPAFRANALQLSAAREQIAGARSGYWPSLSLSAGYGNSYYHLLGSEYRGMNLSFGEQWRQNGRSYVGLNLSIPIFDAFRTRTSIRTAKLELYNLELQRRSLEKNVSKTLQQAELAATLADRRIFASEQTLRASEAAAKLVDERWRVGRASTSELAEARQRAFGAELEWLNAQYEFVLRTRLLELYSHL